MRSTKPRIRVPAVAGAFYPGEPDLLRREIDRLLAGTALPDIRDVRAVIVPHAGYRYSGPVAASAYALLARLSPRPERVVLIGPSHFTGFRGVATPGVDVLATPMGDLPVDHELAAIAESVDLVFPSPAIHAPEHSLEVQLPFVLATLGSVSVLPLLCGDDAPEPGANAIGRLLDCDPTVLVIVSSDLSHYLPRDQARRMDAATAQAIVELRSGDLGAGSACGRTPVAVILVVAARRGWSCRLLDLRTSGDTAGDPHRVVGYGAFALGPSVA